MVKKSGNEKRWLIYVRGLAIALGITAACLGIAAAMIRASLLRQGAAAAAAAVSATVGIFVAAFYTARKRETGKLPGGLAVCGAFDLLLLAGNLLFLDVPPVGFARICLPTLAAALAASLLASRNVRRQPKLRRK